MLQDYFLDLCFHLKKSDIKILKKCELGQQTKGEPLPNPPSVPLAEGGPSPPSPLSSPSLLHWDVSFQKVPQALWPCSQIMVSTADFGALLEDRDDICRRFYLNFSEDIMDLSQYAF